MNVEELIEKLKGEDPKRIVVMAQDRCGNGFHSPCLDFWLGKYQQRPDQPFGVVGLEKLTASDRRRGWSHEDVMEGGVKALILYPEK